MAWNNGREIGYVKLYRQTLSSPIFQDPDLLKLWTWVLLKVSYKEYTVPVRTGKGVTLVTLRPGQMIFGRNSAGNELRSPAKTVSDRMKRLKTVGMVAIQPATHYSVVTVVNWASFQGDSENTAIQAAKRTASQPPTNRHKQEVREVKEERISADADPTLPGIQLDKGNGKSRQETHGRKPKKEYPPAVLDVYQAYCENIVAVPAKMADALRNIAARIKEGYTPKQLIEAVERYFVERQGNPDALPYHANNFFGQKAYFLGYLQTEGAEMGAGHG